MKLYIYRGFAYLVLWHELPAVREPFLIVRSRVASPLMSP
jgi:hypothetical protein